MKQWLEKFPALVVSIPFFEHLVREGIEVLRAKVILSDGSNLHLSEVWIDGQLCRYAYYWLDERNTLIRGWDNAPHHPEIPTRPHHQHIGKNVEPSQVRCLDDVLTLLMSTLF